MPFDFTLCSRAMDKEDFRKNFPPSTDIPEELVKLLEYQNEVQDYYSGSFYLGVEPFPNTTTFDGDAEAASKFVEFGRGPDGSSYAFWLYDDLSLEKAPIVFMGSEGEHWGVLANSIPEFFSLLALGEFELGFSASWDEWSGPESDQENLENFRSWLKHEFGIEPASDPGSVVEQARHKHPDLQDWLDAWAEKHFGSR